MQLFTIEGSKVNSFVSGGVIIDTCVVLEIAKGIMCTRRNTPRASWQEEYERVVSLLELLKININWQKVYITPHIMTETCSHINLGHNRDNDFTDIVKEVFTLLEQVNGVEINKEAVMETYSVGARLEPGDLSIYAVADKFAEQKKKVAILTKDDGFTDRYHKSPYVMVIDYRYISDLG